MTCNIDLVKVNTQVMLISVVTDEFGRIVVELCNLWKSPSKDSARSNRVVD